MIKFYPNFNKYSEPPPPYSRQAEGKEKNNVYMPPPPYSSLYPLRPVPQYEVAKTLPQVFPIPLEPPPSYDAPLGGGHKLEGGVDSPLSLLFRLALTEPVFSLLNRFLPERSQRENIPYFLSTQCSAQAILDILSYLSKNDELNTLLERIIAMQQEQVYTPPKKVDALYTQAKIMVVNLIVADYTFLKDNLAHLSPSPRHSHLRTGRRIMHIPKILLKVIRRSMYMLLDYSFMLGKRVWMFLAKLFFYIAITLDFWIFADLGPG